MDGVAEEVLSALESKDTDKESKIGMIHWLQDYLDEKLKEIEGD